MKYRVAVQRRSLLTINTGIETFSRILYHCTFLGK
jgi:hypothetical protein